MPHSNPKSGKVITFYSFKGGTGRTMAVANIAFLAACNDMRVLVMDWDLEAPGLAYYFRGLLDTSEYRQLSEKSGVLDILTEWSRKSLAADGEELFEDLVAEYKHGHPFERSVSRIFDAAADRDGDWGAFGILDYIGAGARVPQEEYENSYEEKLAELNWKEFYSVAGGGVLLQCFRDWAINNYDLILIDSRTGMADVAGICTMQLPDSVALCFVMNKQNIDGIARVSAAIKSQRKDEVKLNVIPMRVSAQGTADESNAYARALSEFTRTARLSPDEVKQDFELLTVPAMAGVPFMETLTPLHVGNDHLAFLTGRYAKIAGHILDEGEFRVPTLSPNLLELAKIRLQPQLATIGYIKSLLTADPNRASLELQKLIDSALQLELAGDDLEPDYVTALFDAVVEIEKNFAFRIADGSLYYPMLQLLRELKQQDAEKWRGYLISAIEFYLGRMIYSGGEDIASLIDELDSVLEESGTHADAVKRVQYRERLAQLYLDAREYDFAKEAVGELRSLATSLMRNVDALTPQQLDALNYSLARSEVILGDAFAVESKSDSAKREWSSALTRIRDLPTNSSSFELQNLHFDVYRRLAELHHSSGDVKLGAEFALSAGRFGMSPYGVPYFEDLVSIVLDDESEPYNVYYFCDNLFRRDDGKAAPRSAFGQYYSRSLRAGIGFIETAIRIVKVLATLPDADNANVLGGLVEIVSLILRNSLRRRQVIGHTNLTMMKARALELNYLLVEGFDLELDVLGEMAE